MTKIVMFFFWSLVSVSLFAQTPKTNQILKEVEQNNSELKAFKNYEESQKFALKSTNALPSPEVSTTFLPFGSGAEKNTVEMEVSQSFEFPTVYGTRKKMIGKQKEQIRLQYQQKRQEVLLQAKQWLQKIIASKKMEKVDQNRLDKAEKLFAQNQKLFDKGEMNILELNKSKVALIQMQFKVQKIKATKQTAIINLNNLNGGKPISVELSDFEDDFLLPNKQTLWQERLSQSKTLQVQQKAEEVAKQQIKLVKQQNLPNLTLGYVYQGNTEKKLQGVLTGVSIPIWGNKSRRKTAEMQFNFEKSNTENKLLVIKNKFDTQYNEYQSLLGKYDEYKKTLEMLNSVELLYKAYRAGEISFSEYFIELEFYHNAYDAMLEKEEQLHLLKSQLLNHKL